MYPQIDGRSSSVARQAAIETRSNNTPGCSTFHLSTPTFPETITDHPGLSRWARGAN